MINNRDNGGVKVKITLDPVSEKYASKVTADALSIGVRNALSFEKCSGEYANKTINPTRNSSAKFRADSSK
jgi:hypothetical protein